MGGEVWDAGKELVAGQNLDFSVQLSESVVVDTTGRADMSQFKVLKSTHDLFTNAVKASLPKKLQAGLG